MNQITSQCKELRKKLLKKKIQVEDLSQYKEELFEPGFQILRGTHSKEDLEDYLHLCMDYYTFTEDVLIPDFDYDELMERYISLGGSRISTADHIDLEGRWSLVVHEAPEVVGTVEKIYDTKELQKYYEKYRVGGYNEWIIAPKFDGISAAIKIKDGRIVKAVTRYDGYEGQDITPLVKQMKNADEFYKYFNQKNIDGFYKVELCVGSSDFDQLIEIKEYANRRSATSGIINSPKNIELARFVTIIPLAYYSENHDLVYNPLHSKRFNYFGSWEIMYNEIVKILEFCRMADFEFRTDGVVMMPYKCKCSLNDIMSEAKAFKVNTKIGITKIKDIYVSVGRLGKAVPMASVIPVEVNETRVSDVSLGSFDKCVALNLHEGEVVEVFSAGDVIPQIRLPEIRNHDKKASYLKVDLRCPYCGEKLEREGREYFCGNKYCIRITTGRITNFLSKLGAENISDKKVEDLYLSGLIKNIPDIFKLTQDDIQTLEGYAEISALNIMSEIVKIQTQATPIDKFFGALGIPDIGEKKARRIFGIINKDDLRKPDKLFMKLIVADGIGEKTASEFIKFINKNEDLIDELLNVMNVVELRKWKGNIVFTGFRNKSLEEQINGCGYEVSDNVNSQTVMVITSDPSMSSTKCKAAIKKGIQIEVLSDITQNLNRFLVSLRKKGE